MLEPSLPTAWPGGGGCYLGDGYKKRGETMETLRKKHQLDLVPREVEDRREK